MKYFLISFIALIAFWLELSLFNMWQADKSYALGRNLVGVQQYTNAYTYLKEAVDTHPDEPTFRDELAFNQAVIASALFSQNTATDTAKMLKNEAILNSNLVIEQSPNSLVFWKNRTKIFYQLSLPEEALKAITKAVELAPTDAKVHYNYGLLLAHNGQKEESKKVYEETLKLKPNYDEVKDALKNL